MKTIEHCLNHNRFIPIDTEELTALELIGKTVEKTNEVVINHNKLDEEVKENEKDIEEKIKDTNNKKVSHEDMLKVYKNDKGNHIGAWHGVTSPAMSEPGIQGQVLKNIEDIKNLDSQMEDITPKLNVINKSVIYLENEGLLFNGTDETEKLESVINKYAISWSNCFTFVMPTGKSITLNKVKAFMQLKIIGNGCRIDTSEFAFVVKPNSALTLDIENVKLYGGGIAQLIKNRDDGGITLRLSNVVTTGENQTGILLDLKQVDFISIEDLQMWNYDQGIVLRGEIGKSFNTQVNFKNISAIHTKYPLQLGFVDKMVCDNFDISRCATGVIIGQFCKRIKFTSFHCESYGYYLEDSSRVNGGYGILTNNYHEMGEVTFDNSSIFMPQQYAKKGIQLSKISVNSGYLNSALNIKFNDVFIEDKKTLDFTSMSLNGHYTWNGKVNNNSEFDSFGSELCQGNVNAIGSNNINSKKNLVVNDLFESLESFTVEGSTPTVTKSGYLTNILNTSGTTIKCFKSFQPQESGWYSAIFNGDLKRNVFFSKLVSSPYTTIFSKKINNDGYSLTNKVFFYVTPEQLKSINIGFEILANTSIEVSDFKIFRGFVNTQ